MTNPKCRQLQDTRIHGSNYFALFCTACCQKQQFPRECTASLPLFAFAFALVELRCEVFPACGSLWQQSSGSSEEAIRFPLDSCDSQSVKVKKQMHGSDVIGLQWHVGLGFLIMVVKAVMVVTRS